MANTYISRAATGTRTSYKTFTFSFWLKRGNLTETQTIFMHENAASHNEKFQLELQSDDTFRVSVYDGSVEFNYDTNMLFRDINAWYNVVVRWDTTQSTSTDRVRIYVNGSQITFDNANGSTATMPNQNFALDLGEKIMVWGRYQASSPGAYFNGSLSHCHYADGQSYAPTVFGSVDSVTGEWQINPSPTVTYGNNGFFILKDGNRVVNDAGNSSGNFAVSGGALTPAKDCPSNVFATMNHLANFAGQWALFENQNTYVRSAGSGEAFIASTLGIPATSGKFYTEVKYTAGGSYSVIGISGRMSPTASGDYAGNKADSYVYRQNGQKKSNDIDSSYGNSYAPGDIIGIAVDATNSKLYFSKNGTWQNSGNPASGSTGTGAISISATPTDGFYFMACAKESASTKNFYAWNFGNGYYQTTAITTNSGNGYAGAEGASKFSYAVPSGYSALSTKGLNQ